MVLRRRWMLAAGVAIAAGLAGCREQSNTTPPPKPANAAEPARNADGAAANNQSPHAMTPAMDGMSGTDPHAFLASRPSTMPPGMALPEGHPPIPAHTGMNIAPADDDGMRFTAPAAWIQEAPTTMRKEQYRLPRVEGDQEDGLLYVSYFPGMGGSTQLNIDRWISQFTQPDGTPSKDAAHVETLTVRDMPVTILRITGTFMDRQPDFEMLGAVIESSAGPYFVKATGPKKTMAAHEAEFKEFVRSAQK